MTRLIIIPKTMSIVVETVFKKSNFILFSGLNRAANKIGDAIITKTKTNFVFSFCMVCLIEKYQKHI